ncbi:hypothetical protein COOONC_27376, partial [Cooperia oncophora]
LVTSDRARPFCWYVVTVLLVCCYALGDLVHEVGLQIQRLIYLLIARTPTSLSIHCGGRNGGGNARCIFLERREKESYPPRAAMQPPVESSSRSSPLSVQTNATMSVNFKVQMWQNRPLDSGVHTMTHSQAPSVISMTSIHAGSQISTMSSAIDTDAAELTDQQQQKFE